MACSRTKDINLAENSVVMPKFEIETTKRSLKSMTDRRPLHHTVNKQPPALKLVWGVFILPVKISHV